MDEVDASEAEVRFSALLDRVEAGERIVITHHGKPVALLGPMPGESDRSVGEAVRGLLELRSEHRLGPGLTTLDLIREGRKR